MKPIAVDAMGGDDAPRPEVAGAIAAVRESSVRVILVGEETQLRAMLHRLGAGFDPAIDVCHASQAVAMDDEPSQAYRRKRDSSLRVAFDLVQSGRASAVVSAGNSGAVLSHAVLVLGRIPGVVRPGIVAVFPTPTGSLVLCDMGANVEVKASNLAQFAILGAGYDRVVFGRIRPRVGLLSNGTEAKKGTELTRAADALLRRAAEHPDVQFAYAGYVEGIDLFRGEIDVVVTDGFTGNVVLKVSEGVAEAFLHLVKKELAATALGRLGSRLVRGALLEVKKKIDYAEIGGALLVGVRGQVMICHGRSDATAVKNAIKTSQEFVRAGLTGQLEAAIVRHRGLWEADAETATKGTG